MKYLLYLLLSLFLPIIKVALGFTMWNIVDVLVAVLLVWLWDWMWLNHRIGDRDIL